MLPVLAQQVLESKWHILITGYKCQNQQNDHPVTVQYILVMFTILLYLVKFVKIIIFLVANLIKQFIMQTFQKLIIIDKICHLTALEWLTVEMQVITCNMNNTNFYL